VQGEAILQTVAEISVAFAGFTGVVVAFGRHGEADAPRVEALAFKAMLASSLQVLLFSVLPFLLDAAGLSAAIVWRAGSGLMSLGLVAGAAVDVAHMRRVPTSELSSFDRVFRVAIPVLGAATLLAQLANLAGAVERGFAAYLGGLLYLLFFSSIMFVRLVTVPGSRG
jgi:hypothetical protein